MEGSWTRHLFSTQHPSMARSKSGKFSNLSESGILISHQLENFYLLRWDSPCYCERIERWGNCARPHPGDRNSRSIEQVSKGVVKEKHVAFKATSYQPVKSTGDPGVIMPKVGQHVRQRINAYGYRNTYTVFKLPPPSASIVHLNSIHIIRLL